MIIRCVHPEGYCKVCDCLCLCVCVYNYELWPVHVCGTSAGDLQKKIC